MNGCVGQRLSILWVYAPILPTIFFGIPPRPSHQHFIPPVHQHSKTQTEVPVSQSPKKRSRGAMANPAINFVRLASRPFRSSTRGLISVSDHVVRRCNTGRVAVGDTLQYTHVKSRRTKPIASDCYLPFLPQLKMERIHPINGESRRFFSQKGKKSKDEIIYMDRTKFTHEVKVELPEVAENAEGECFFLFDGENLQLKLHLINQIVGILLYD